MFCCSIRTPQRVRTKCKQHIKRLHNKTNFVGEDVDCDDDHVDGEEDDDN